MKPRIWVAAALLGCLLAAGCKSDTVTTAPPLVAQTPTPSVAASPTPAAVAVHAGDAAAGKKVFAVTCTACHGENARGIKGMGKDLTASAFVKSLTDAQLLDFIKKGREANDPANTTHVAMPPNGGNMQASDQDLMNAVAYIRSLKR